MDGEAFQGRIVADSQYQMQCGVLLNVIVRQGTAILQLLPGKNQPLLVDGNALFIGYLLLHHFYGVRRLHIQGYGLAGQSLNVNGHGKHLLLKKQRDNKRNRQ
ncbi:hypothetical protein D1872_244310 [compost metagenome]